LDKSAKTKLINDIENQLDDFFGEQGAPKASPAPALSLQKLKSAVLSIDWEISDACLAELINETENLLPKFEKDPISHAMLRMMGGLGRYIGKRKAQAHQDAIKRILSVFATLELLMEDPRLSQEKKQRIAAKEIQAFKKLKEQIEFQNPPAVKVQAPVTAAAPNVAETSARMEPQDIKQAMNEMEQRLNTEVKALKSQLAALERELSALRKR
jgi:hypothetical protein